MSEDIFKEEISKHIADALGVAVADIYDLLELPRDRKMGDLALPCFTLAKQMKQSPQQIAALISEKLSKVAWQKMSHASAIGPFVNFFYKTPELAAHIVKNIRAVGAGFGLADEGQRQKILIDFSSPNIAKPFGIGHLRSTVIGNALYHIFEKLGYECIGINHLGDWGTQFGKMIVAYREWGSEEMLEEDPVHALFDLYTKFHREAKSRPDLDEEARRQFRLLEHGDAEATELWGRFKRYSLAEFNRIYDILGIKFDYFTGESFYNDKMDAVLRILDDKNLTKISQEALIVDLEEYDLGACLLKKGDDATLYATRDLAGILFRHQEFDFARCLYVVGAAQSLHFKQVFKVIELVGYDYADRLVHVPFGWVRFEDKAMSTREGNIIFLEEVIAKSRDLAREIILEKNPEIEDFDGTAEAIGVGAVIFAQTSVRRMKDIDFRWETALSFEGETGPYLQYTHARLCSLGRKFGKDIPDSIDFGLLKEEEEKHVLSSLMQYPERIRQAAREYEPFVISSYLISLAQEFNTYYQKHRVITDNTSLSEARMTLCDCVRIILADGLRILGVVPLERM
ncbi:MAG: arginine--tRNA ligase [Candidatus Zixiibacteriota bacterium]